MSPICAIYNLFCFDEHRPTLLLVFLTGFVLERRCPHNRHTSDLVPVASTTSNTSKISTHLHGVSNSNQGIIFDCGGMQPTQLTIFYQYLEAQRLTVIVELLLPAHSHHSTLARLL